MGRPFSVGEALGASFAASLDEAAGGVAGVWARIKLAASSIDVAPSDIQIVERMSRGYHKTRMWIRSLAMAFALSSSCALAQLTTITTTLSPRTTEAFESYLKSNEPQMNHKGKTRFAQMKPDEVRVEPTKDTGTIPVKGGMVHDWVAANSCAKGDGGTSSCSAAELFRVPVDV